VSATIHNKCFRIKLFSDRPYGRVLFIPNDREATL
jgi:hypothetical protein